ncbi:pentapeptide repeat-containing protein [Amycolatopsis sp. DG1A-15b]|uniref:pentapeptide repeat-containing protein n=1 Tax=Amycolatopsis sp. DG1A-15b TaxID=3052846 RepID=UPI00255B7BE4|nr:pentapeptide repeat-containing protein [Amycolatopsis sp. DG1A-15b]WIX88202.1 pentapeptide repeat-containing protein [Amycolatopsis sp. DG1A-15b]
MTDENPPSAPAPEVPAPPALAARVRAARLRELSPQAMLVIAVLITALTAGAVVVLWWLATAGLNGAELVTARLDALKIGLSVGAGSGGVVALYLAWRRQRSTEADLDNRERALFHQQEVAASTMAHQDRVARATEHDAAERRLTELYLKAVEQLGSVQAAVRHGGLYALERVAQDNPSQRQTVVDVICAYLRNPYTPPPEVGGPRRSGVRRPLLRSTHVRPAAMPVPSPESSPAWHNRLQEREVRLAAQRVLRRHLQPGDDLQQPQRTFWTDIDLDLTGATLIDFTFSNCHVGTASFNGATFVGSAGFGETIFAGGAWFDRAIFSGDAWFDGVTFVGGAGFTNGTFARHAKFTGTTFANDAWFGWATFTEADFSGATFTGGALFYGATEQGSAFDPVER